MGQPSPQPYGAGETFWMRTTYASVSPANATRGASIVNASRAGGGVLSGDSVGHGAGASGKKMPSPSDMPGTSHRPPPPRPQGTPPRGRAAGQLGTGAGGGVGGGGGMGGGAAWAGSGRPGVRVGRGGATRGDGVEPQAARSRPNAMMGRIATASC